MKNSKSPGEKGSRSENCTIQFAPKDKTRGIGILVMAGPGSMVGPNKFVVPRRILGCLDKEKISYELLD